MTKEVDKCLECKGTGCKMSSHHIPRDCPSCGGSGKGVRTMKLVLDIPNKLAPVIAEIIRAYGRDDDGLSDANMMRDYNLTVPEAVEADRLFDEILSQLEAKTD